MTNMNVGAEKVKMSLKKEDRYKKAEKSKLK